MSLNEKMNNLRKHQFDEETCFLESTKFLDQLKIIQTFIALFIKYGISFKIPIPNWPIVNQLYFKTGVNLKMAKSKWTIYSFQASFIQPAVDHTILPVQ